MTWRGRWRMGGFKGELFRTHRGGRVPVAGSPILRKRGIEEDRKIGGRCGPMTTLYKSPGLAVRGSRSTTGEACCPSFVQAFMLGRAGIRRIRIHRCGDGRSRPGPIFLSSYLLRLRARSARSRPLPPLRRLAGLRLVNRRGEDVAAAGIVADACGDAQPVVQFIRIALRKFGNRVDSKHAEVFARRRPDVRELEEFVFGFRSGHRGRGGAGGLFCRESRSGGK